MSHTATCFGSHEPSSGTSFYDSLKTQTHLSVQLFCKTACSNVPTFFKLQQELPDDGWCESKQVAVCKMTQKCCDGQHIFVCL